MKKYLHFIYLLISLVCLFVIAMQSFNHTSKNTKVAYIRTAFLIEKFSGTTEARLHYQNKMEEWQSEIDTLNYQLTLLKKLIKMLFE